MGVSEECTTALTCSVLSFADKWNCRLSSKPSFRTSPLRGKLPGRRGCHSRLPRLQLRGRQGQEGIGRPRRRGGGGMVWLLDERMVVVAAVCNLFLSLSLTFLSGAEEYYTNNQRSFPQYKLLNVLSSKMAYGARRKHSCRHYLLS